MNDKNNKKQQLIDYKFIMEKTANILLAAWFGFFAYRFYVDFYFNNDFSSLLFLIKESLLVFFFLFRKQSVSFSLSPIDWALAFIGTFLGLAVEPIEGENLFVTFIQSVATIWIIVSYFSLGKSISLVPADRGIKTKGTYQYIRHPLYSAYIISFSCILINNISYYNILVISGLAIALIGRMYREEKFLMNSNPDYQKYMQQTPYRLIPKVF